MPINSSVATRTHLRPSRSPKWEKIRPPSGRAAKPTAYVLKEAMNPTAGDTSGKKMSLNTNAAAVP